ncbi:ATP-dependent DNA helicase HFM1/MER3 [Apostasia shenzhenica]|uniref:ATP-dependent DNA helicase HFM1/MER3 n=1 Tax=Apostasia shenzhenica TaxID=1088818 RepID=A0A2I0AF99_9ASPA|nr:ATP-dependent DNA helicase HFM1/MER3 [Apostasia shenzhenica]
MAAAELGKGEPKFRSLFDLPFDFFDSCRFLASHPSITPADQPYSLSHPESSATTECGEGEAGTEEPNSKVTEEKGKGTSQRWTCNICRSEFESLEDQRSHFKCDLHRLNVKLSVSGKNIVKEEDVDDRCFDSVFEDLDVSSISGSEDELEEGLFPRVVSSVKKGEGVKQKLYIRLRSGESVSMWRCLILDECEDLSVYYGIANEARIGGSSLLVTEDDLNNRLKCLLREPRDKTNLRIVFLLSGGHFVGCVFDGSSVIAHKTFHRYVVRAKAGKKQSAKDATGKSAHSAGSSLRRYNEAALKKEIQNLLSTWHQYINSSVRIFVHCPSKNRQILFDGGNPQLNIHDRVICHIPLTIHRPTFKEAKRIYQRLTQLSYEVDSFEEFKICKGDEGESSQLCNEPPVSELEVEIPPPQSIPAEGLPNSANVSFSLCENLTTPLHEAAKSGDAQQTLELLEQGCDPCLKDVRGRTPYLLAAEKEVRNVFRRFMASNLDRWDWQAAHVPSPLTKEMEESQACKQAEKEAKRKAKTKELKKLRKAKEKAKAEEAKSQDISTIVSQHQGSVRVTPSIQQQSNILRILELFL